MSDTTQNKRTIQVDFEPVGRRTEIKSGETLLDAAQAAGVELVAVCGGMGICEGCRIRLARGELSPLSLEEDAILMPDEIAEGYRLACQSVPISDVKIDIPAESLTTPQRLQLEGAEAEIPLNPPVCAVNIKIQVPNMYDLRSDLTRLTDALKEDIQLTPRIHFPLLGTISEDLRKSEWMPRLVLKENEIIAVFPSVGGTGLQGIYGLAVDVGTTKLAGYLVDMGNGKTVSRVGAMNPQIGYGEDVVSRIVYATEKPNGRTILQNKLLEVLNQMVAELCFDAKTTPQNIVEAVVVGNTAMHHLFAGLPVQQLGMAPYVPAVSQAIEIQAERLGLHLAPGAYVYMPANIAGYVGADHLAMDLSTGIGQAPGKRNIVALDIGTNTEISLESEGQIYSCSCASGPAFEGAHIREGMRAAPGAIERVTYIDGEFRIHTIGDKPPVGICGSGILDAIASMLKAGILDKRGNLLPDHPLVRSVDGKRAVLLAPAEKSGHGRDLFVTRQDVNEIQLAKGAIRAGIRVLLAEAGLANGKSVGEEKLDRVIVAGAFGTYLDIGSAIRVGMFPHLPLDRFQQVGNAAGAGARQMLVSIDRRKTADLLAKRINYIELTTHSHFTDEYIRAIMFEDPQEKTHEE
jgi:uncharacterized 2Fe-2S/4Fe-4S cluster protein (DUF4445 family)